MQVLQPDEDEFILAKVRLIPKLHCNVAASYFDLIDGESIDQRPKTHLPVASGFSDI
jgi:hypothetical protein